MEDPEDGGNGFLETLTCKCIYQILRRNIQDHSKLLKELNRLSCEDTQFGIVCTQICVYNLQFVTVFVDFMF